MYKLLNSLENVGDSLIVKGVIKDNNCLKFILRSGCIIEIIGKDSNQTVITRLLPLSDKLIPEYCAKAEISTLKLYDRVLTSYSDYPIGYETEVSGNVPKHYEPFFKVKGFKIIDRINPNSINTLTRIKKITNDKGINAETLHCCDRLVDVIPNIGDALQIPAFFKGGYIPEQYIPFFHRKGVKVTVDNETEAIYIQKACSESKESILKLKAR